MSTTGVDFKVKVMDATGPDGRPKRVKVTIWDTGTCHIEASISDIELSLNNFVRFFSDSWPGAVQNPDELVLPGRSRNYSR